LPLAAARVSASHAIFCLATAGGHLFLPLMVGIRGEFFLKKYFVTG